jgi:hypothetical protein
VNVYFGLFFENQQKSRLCINIGKMGWANFSQTQLVTLFSAHERGVGIETIRILPKLLTDSTLGNESTKAGYLSNQLPHCTSETMKARSFPAAKNSIVIFETV